MAGVCALCGSPISATTGSCPSCGIIPPPKKTNVWKIVLIVVAVIFALGVVAVGGLGYMGWRAMHSNGNGMTMGQAANVSEADLGVSVYPGAVRVDSGSLRMKVLGTETESASYTTSDQLTSVVTYYQGKLGSASTTTEHNGTTMILLKNVNGNAKESVTVTLQPSVQAAGQTQIMISHIKAAVQ